MRGWAPALAAWSPYTRLKPPLLCPTSAEAESEGLTGSFAMIRLVDQTVVIDLEQVLSLGIDDYAVEVLAHEIGHHVYAPASITDHTRSLARMLPALPTVSQHAPMIANLYTDLLINDRLMRSAGLRMPALMEAVVREGEGKSRLWQLYLRIYEILWGLAYGALTHVNQRDDAIEVDARLAARLVRHYARHWLDGAGRFAVIVLPYLIDDRNASEPLAVLMDTRHAGLGGQPEGLTQMDPGELDGLPKPGESDDFGEGSRDKALAEARARGADPNQRSTGQARDPFQYGELLKLAGLKLNEQEAAIRYYKERAQPYLVPFPTLPADESEDPLPEGLDLWESGDPLELIDWRESLSLSPRPIPGLTTVQRHYGTQPGHERARQPLDLDLYVDSSGSMPDPRSALSWPALAGAVICLSALRAGAAVQVSLWSGHNQVTTTKGFVRSADDALRVLTGYYGGSTQFPLPTLRETHAARAKLKRPTHILQVSDDGASTMFDTPDERGTPGWDICAKALAQAGGGGTLALNIPAKWESAIGKGQQGRLNAYDWIARARAEQGWLVSPVATLEDLLGFALAFTRRHYDVRSVRA